LFDKLIDIIKSVGFSASPALIINNYEGGILLRLGKYKKTLGSGMHLKIPVFDKIMKLDMRTRFYSQNSASLTTRDGVQITVSPVLSFKAHCAKEAILSHVEYGNPVWDGSSQILSRLVLAHDYDDIMSDQFINKFQDEMKKYCLPYGILMLTSEFDTITKAKAYRVMTK